MQQESNATRAKCGVETTIAVVGGKWKPMILLLMEQWGEQYADMVGTSWKQ
jgi:DNA-binding HxlR family transcriptional regulator